MCASNIAIPYEGEPILHWRFQNQTLLTGSRLLLNCSYFSDDLLNTFLEIGKTESELVDDFGDDDESAFEMIQNVKIEVGVELSENCRRRENGNLSLFSDKK